MGEIVRCPPGLEPPPGQPERIECHTVRWNGVAWVRVGHRRPAGRVGGHSLRRSRVRQMRSRKPLRPGLHLRRTCSAQDCRTTPLA
eukprot:12589970-Alexandrium_andersonii.AAC.1